MATHQSGEIPELDLAVSGKAIPAVAGEVTGGLFHLPVEENSSVSHRGERTDGREQEINRLSFPSCPCAVTFLSLGRSITEVPKRPPLSSAARRVPWAKTFIGFALSAFIVLVSLRISLASEPPVNQTDGIALKGYDPVAYFTENKAVQGSDQFTAQYQGSTYRFESAANRDVFNASPARHVPQYGGYCAYGVANGHKADISPEAFTIVNDKLY